MLKVRVQPRASRDEIVGLMAGQLKLRLKSPPVDGAANQQLVRFLAKQLKVPQQDIELIRGQTSRDKLVAIAESGCVVGKLMQLLAKGRVA